MPDAPRTAAVEALGSFAAVTAIAAVLYRIRALDDYFHALVAALFLYAPALLVWRRGRELERYGVRARPVARNVLLALAVAALVLPPFALGFAAFQRLACAVPLLRPLAAVGCAHAGAVRLALRLPPDAGRFVLAELLVVALPEELFFRGWLQGRLDELWAPRVRLLGAPVGPALPVAAALFALCHVAVQGNLQTAAVFFPGLLFGWLRARNGSILPGTLFHAACNVYIETLHRSLYG